MTARDCDRVREIAAQVDAMATAVNGLSTERNPTERELLGMKIILVSCAQELDDMADGVLEKQPVFGERTASPR